MTVWTRAVLAVLYACVLHFSICTCSAQPSMYHMERCSRNTLTIIIIIIITSVLIKCSVSVTSLLVSSSSVLSVLHHC